MTRSLADALSSVDWLSSVDDFCRSKEAVSRCTACMERMARWARQLEEADSGNPAIVFVREAQVQAHYVACLVGLALYKPAAGAIRAAVESMLYYSYFRSHPSELATLVRSARYYVSKAEIIDFHREHTPEFRGKEQCLGLVGRLDEWYSEASAIVHGQIPGKWVSHTDLAKIAPDVDTIARCLDLFERGERIIHELLLCTSNDLWTSFSVEARRVLSKGLAPNVKQTLGL